MLAPQAQGTEFESPAPTKNSNKKVEHGYIYL